MTAPSPLPFGGRLPSSFVRRRVVLPPASSRPYVDEEWRDALVTVESGEVDLECEHGARRRFERGAVLWFAGLGLRTIANRGAIPTVLVAISRRARAP